MIKGTPSSKQKIAIVDATGAEKGRRRFTRDAIGCGPRSVCGVLEQFGIESRIFLAEDVLAKGIPKKFTTLFISGMSMDKVAVKRIVNYWRKSFSGKVVVGGPITSELEFALKTTKADLIVIGEGELTLKELIETGFLENELTTDELEKIAGIGFFSSKREVTITRFRPYSSREEFRRFNPSTARIKDYPNYFSAKTYVECIRGCSNFKGTKMELVDGRKCLECGYCDNGSLEGRANCPADIPPGCGFCSVPSLFGPARSRSADQIVEEIEHLLELGVKRIVLSAPDFLDLGRDEFVAPEPLIHPSEPKANEERIEELLSRINSLESVSKGKAWVEVENVKASLFTEEFAKKLSRYFPNSPFSIGCETGSEEHSAALGRPSGPKDALRAVKIAKKYGLKVHIYFIHSLPGQTKQTAKETVELINKLEPYVEKVTIYRFRPLPLSAFGDFPPPEPAIKNPDSQSIVEAAKRVNLRKKKELVGKIVKVIISEPNIRDEKGAIGYILGGGPMVAVKKGRTRLGEILAVKIEKAITEKLVLGRIILTDVPET